MDRDEARLIAERELMRVRGQAWADLVGLVDSPEWSDVEGPSGQRYAVQLLGLWDAGRAGGNLRVRAVVCEVPSWPGPRWVPRSVPTETCDFIMTPAGGFVGE